MAEKYVLDACALIAALTDEDGADKVADVFTRAMDSTSDVTVAMHRINVLEVYYDTYKNLGKDGADKFLDEIKENPVEIVSDLSDDFLKEAGRLKGENRISLADAIVLALARRMGAKLLTSDHHEMDKIEEKGEVVIAWIR